jgi:Mlc titration factor MtfA (ptsG expression regulator)
MIFRWLRNRRRLRLLAGPFPPKWLECTERVLPAYVSLTERERLKLQDDIRLFIGEKNWEGCGGLDLDDEIRVTIACQACLLILGLEYDYFDRVQSILVYPEPFVTPDADEMGGVVQEFESELSGLAEYRGPVVLTWSEVREDLDRPGDGRNLVIHEFAHKLDMLDSRIDGTPPLETREQYARWRAVMTAEFERLSTASRRGKRSLLDRYGTFDEGEFFAVVTECFFELPRQMERHHPQLYAVLRDFYKQDPAARAQST